MAPHAKVVTVRPGDAVVLEAGLRDVPELQPHLGKRGVVIGTQKGNSGAPAAAGDGTGATSGTSSDGNGPHSLVKCSVKLKPSGTILQRVPLDCVVPARIAPVLAVSRTDIVEVTAHELLDRDRRAKGYIGQAGVVVKVVDSGDATGMLLVTMGDGCVLRLAPAMVKRMQPTA